MSLYWDVGALIVLRTLWRCDMLPQMWEGLYGAAVRQSISAIVDADGQAVRTGGDAPGRA